MKALTIYQPWASLVIAGAKPYEFRKWSPRERGGAYAALIGQRIAIHASQRPIDRPEVQRIIADLRAGKELAARRCLHADKALPILERALVASVSTETMVIGTAKHGDLPWSCVLGTAIMGEPRSGYDIAEEFGLPHVNDSDRDEEANFGWPMLEIEAWDSPVPMRGAQGFWNMPTPEALGIL
jgi:hypothetical protein